MRFSLSALGVVVHQTAVKQDLPLVIGQAPDVQHEGVLRLGAQDYSREVLSLPCPTSFRTSGTKTQSPGWQSNGVSASSVNGSMPQLMQLLR